MHITDDELKQLWLIRNCIGYNGTWQGKGWFTWKDLIAHMGYGEDFLYDNYDEPYDKIFGYGVAWDKSLAWKVVNNEILFISRWAKNKQGKSLKLYCINPSLPNIDETICRWKNASCFVEKMAEYLIDSGMLETEDETE